MHPSRSERIISAKAAFLADVAARRAASNASLEVEKLHQKTEGLLQNLLDEGDERTAISILKELRRARSELVIAKKRANDLRKHATDPLNAPLIGMLG